MTANAMTRGRFANSNVPFVLFDSIDSTNTWSAQALASGTLCEADCPIAIMARQQSQGRGRGGNAWSSGVGNLFLTLVYALPKSVQIGGSLSLVAGVSLARVLEQNYALKPTLKWPNDVLIEGAKLAGILPEAVALPNGGFAVGIGVGLNICHAPALKDKATACLDQLLTGEVPSALSLAQRLCDQLVEDLNQWCLEGFAPFRAQWSARSYGLGESMVIRLPNERFEAQFGGIDDNGTLLARLPSGEVRSVGAGEVFFGESA